MDLGRWHKLMEQFEMPPCDDVFEALRTAYSEKHRYYHNHSHIDAVLKHLDKVQHIADKPHEIEMALWFHDAVYKTFSSNNELDSANWASDFLRSNGRPNDEANRVHDMIMATLHDDRNGSKDEALMVDIDLAILGAQEDVYDQFEKNIRKEYRLVPYLLYRFKRKEILKSFLERDLIYKNAYFYDRLEKQARINIKTAIDAL